MRYPRKKGGVAVQWLLLFLLPLQLISLAFVRCRVSVNSHHLSITWLTACNGHTNTINWTTNGITEVSLTSEVTFTFHINSTSFHPSLKPGTLVIVWSHVPLEPGPGTQTNWTWCPSLALARLGGVWCVPAQGCPSLCPLIGSILMVLLSHWSPAQVLRAGPTRRMCPPAQQVNIELVNWGQVDCYLTWSLGVKFHK